MRTILSALALLTASLSAAEADPQRFHAAVARITVQDTVPFDTLIAYPTAAAEAPFQIGPFTIAASRDAPIASGARHPVVLFSHGNGRSAGTSLPHRGLATHLAREGFIVVAPFHPGGRLPLQDRPRQVRKALDAVLAEPRFASHADSTRVGMMGFSFGGAVALAVSGAVPNLAHLSAYCRGRADDPRACDGVPADPPSGDTIRQRPVEAPFVKALVLMEPFGALFDRDGLKSVDMPTLLYRAERSDLKADGNIAALAAGLPRPPRLETTPGGHFIFFSQCPPVVEAEAPAACNDSPGVDRAAVHRRIEAEIADFLRRNL
jgi:predicted dienelactone hydrolase